MKFTAILTTISASVLVSGSTFSAPVLAQNICQVPKETTAIISEKGGTNPWKVYFLGRLSLIIREASNEEKACIEKNTFISNGILNVRTSEGYLEVKASNK